MNSRQYDDLIAQLSAAQADNTRLRDNLASATEKASHIPGLIATLDGLHWALSLVRERLDQDANVELTEDQRAAFRVIIEDIPRRSWPPTGQDIEQARLERAVAEAAVAYDHAVANYTDWLAPQQAYQRASTALRAFIIDGKGEAK